MTEIKCPKCKKQAVKVDYMGSKCIVCDNCGYDECKDLEVYPEEKSNQREKGKFSPYKAGGPKRSQKK